MGGCSANTEEANAWLKAYVSSCDVPDEDVLEIGTHSCKATLLSWVAKWGMKEEYRRRLGGHARPGERSILEYSRDALSVPLERLDELLVGVRLKRFKPDSTRPGRRGVFPSVAERIERLDLLVDVEAKCTEDLEDNREKDKDESSSGGSSSKGEDDSETDKGDKDEHEDDEKVENDEDVCEEPDEIVEEKDDAEHDDNEQDEEEGEPPLEFEGRALWRHNKFGTHTQSQSN